MRHVQAVALLILIAAPVFAGPFQGLGFSSKTCVDLDGDGYGAGPIASLITTSTTAVTSVGIHTVTLGSVTGLVLGMRIRYDVNSGSGENLEFVQITAISGSTVTGNFLMKHASGVSVSAGTVGDSVWFPGSATDDPGCLAHDADDHDATVKTAAQGITKYGSLALFLAKLGRDVQLYEGDVAAGQIQATAAGALLTNTANTYYLAPASPSGSCTGTSGQCTGSDSNACTINAPCLTVSGAVSHGYSSTGVGGDILILRDNWDGLLTLWSGASGRYNGAISYPGEMAVIDYNASSSNQVQVGQPSCGSSGTSYVWLDGIRVKNGSSITGGSLGPFYCPGQTTSSNHDVLITHINGTEGGNQGLAPISGFNGLVNWSIEYSVLHDDNCPSSCNTPHGLYLGSHEIAGDALTFRRNLVFRNSYNGIHWNGLMTNAIIDQNVVYDNGVAGADIQNGLQNSFIRSNIFFNNAKEFSLDDYPGNCPTQAGYDSGAPTQCPHDQTSNLIENNVFYHTGNANITFPGNSPDSGCSAGIDYCHKGAIIIDNSANPELNLGSNTYRNNIVVSYGASNFTLPVTFGNPVSGGSCNAACQAWAATSTFDHNVFWQSDGAGGNQVLRIGGSSYTCATAGTVTAAFTSCAVGDPTFVAGAITEWNVESYFDFRIFPNSPAYHTGSTTGLPNYDTAGNVFVETTPSRGAMERQIYSQGWNALTGAGLTSSTAPADGSPSNLSCLGSGGTFTSTPPCSSGADKYPFTSLYYHQLTAWTDGIMRDSPGKPKQLCWWGGGHGDYVGNEVDCISLNIATPAFARVSGPSQYYGGNSGGFVLDWTNCPTALSDGTPNVTHSTSSLVYDPKNDAMAKFGGATAGGCSAHEYDTFSLAMSTATWTQKDGPSVTATCTDQGTGFGSCLVTPTLTLGHQIAPYSFLHGTGQSGFSGNNVYDPLTGSYWIYWDITGGNAFLTQYFPAVNQHVLRATGLFSLSSAGTGQGANRVLIGDRRLILYIDWNTVSATAFTLDISGNTSTTPTSSPNPTTSPITLDSSCDAFTHTPAMGLSYNPIIGRVVAYPSGTGGDTFYLMDPSNWTCTAVSVFSGGPPSSPLNPYLHGKWQYSPSMDVFPSINDVGANVPSVLKLSAGDPSNSTCNITPTILGPYTNTQVISQTMTAGSCGVSTLTWTSSGLPAGLSGCNSVTGTTCAITGTLTTATTYTPTISVTDGSTNTASINPTVVVNAVPVITTSSPLPDATVGVGYSQSLAASGGTLPLIWTLNSGSIPTGMSLSTSGVISGTALSASGSPFTSNILVTDANGLTDNKNFVITVNAPFTTTSNSSSSVILKSGTIKQ